MPLRNIVRFQRFGDRDLIWLRPISYQSIAGFWFENESPKARSHSIPQ